MSKMIMKSGTQIMSQGHKLCKDFFSPCQKDDVIDKVCLLGEAMLLRLGDNEIHQIMFNDILVLGLMLKFVFTTVTTVQVRL